MNQVFEIEHKTQYPRRWSDQFMKANATMEVKRLYPRALKVQCLGLRRWEQPPTPEKRFDWGQSLAYKIVLPENI